MLPRCSNPQVRGHRAYMRLPLLSAAISCRVRTKDDRFQRNSVNIENLDTKIVDLGILKNYTNPSEI
jgi:hypothetical protein